MEQSYSMTEATRLLRKTQRLPHASSFWRAFEREVVEQASLPEPRQRLRKRLRLWYPLRNAPKDRLRWTKHRQETEELATPFSFQFSERKVKSTKDTLSEGWGTLLIIVAQVSTILWVVLEHSIISHETSEKESFSPRITQFLWHFLFSFWRVFYSVESKDGWKILGRA